MVMTWKRAGMASMAGAPKRTRASRKLRMKPPTIAGSASGSVIVRMTARRPAPAMRAASSRSAGVAVSAALVRMKTTGNV